VYAKRPMQKYRKDKEMFLQNQHLFLPVRIFRTDFDTLTAPI